MGAGSVVIGIFGILLIIAIFAYGSQFSDLISGGYSAYLQGVVNNAIKPIPKPGQQVCTLDVGFHATLVGAFLQINQQISIPGGAYKVTFFNCQGSLAANSLMPMLNKQIFSAKTLDFLTGNFGTGGTYHFNAMLIGDDGSRLYPIINPVEQKFRDTLTVDDQHFDLSFTFLHATKQHYILQLSSPEIGIGSGDQGSTYNQQINP